MSEIELIELISDTAKDGKGRFNEFTNNILHEEATPENLDKIKKSFESELKGALKGYEVKIDPQSKEFTLSKGTEKIDIKKIKKKMSGEFTKEGVYTYDLKRILEEMKVPDIDSPQNSAKIDSIQRGYENSANYKLLTETRRLQMNAEKLSKQLGEVKSESEYKEKYDKLSKESKAKIDELQKKLDEKSKSTVGTWLKRAASIYGAISVYEAVKQHQKEINGCWLINTVSGNQEDKCKVSRLTCPGANKTSQNFRNCGECHTDCKGAYFDPCLKDNSIQTKQPSSNDICSNCTCTSDCTDTSINCMNCVVTKFNIPAGYTLYCKNVDFFGSLVDLTNSTLDTAENIVSKIVNILKYIALGIIILFVIYLMIRLILYLIQNSKGSKKKK